MRTRSALLFAFLSVILVFAAPLAAQVNVTLAWDASPSASEPGNPIKYRLYVCSDQALSECGLNDTGTALEYGPLELSHASTTYFYATAYNYVLEVDGTVSGELQESEKSNVLQVKAFSPPGNPSNNRIRVTELSGRHRGRTRTFRAANDTFRLGLPFDRAVAARTDARLPQ